MSVKIGSARIDENGNTTGGEAGDQTGKEVSTQDWYLHSKGWVLLRPDEDYAEDIAQAMEDMCDNSHIGYDQNQRNTLYTQAKAKNWKISSITTDCECDCSSAVRVCLACAGITVSDFNTSSEASTLVNSGYFTKYTASKYTTSSSYLKRGDILVTKTKGHTVVVLDDGGSAESSTTISTSSSSGGFDVSTLSNIKSGSKGDQVTTLQLLLNGKNSAGLSVDGIAGTKTVSAIKSYQKAQSLSQDGICGPKTWAAILGA